VHGTFGFNIAISFRRDEPTRLPLAQQMVTAIRGFPVQVERHNAGDYSASRQTVRERYEASLSRLVSFSTLLVT